jgi:hypothetical protein
VHGDEAEQLAGSEQARDREGNRILRTVTRQRGAEQRHQQLVRSDATQVRQLDVELVGRKLIRRRRRRRMVERQFQRGAEWSDFGKRWRACERRIHSWPGCRDGRAAQAGIFSEKPLALLPADRSGKCDNTLFSRAH